MKQATVPNVLRGTALARRFRYWRGESGRRYLTRILPLDEAADFGDAPVVLVSVGPGGEREVCWVGMVGTPAFERALRGAPARAVEAHLHLLAATPRERAFAVRDLTAVLGFGCERRPSAVAA